MRRAHDHGAWHGPSVSEVLAGVSAAQAAAHPIPGAHSIWELVLHITGWRGEVVRRLEGAEPGMPSEGDWPLATDISEAAWAEARRRCDDSYHQLAGAVLSFAERNLDDKVGRQPPDPALGTVGSFYVMLHGVPQHDAYHMGQVAMLRKLL